MPRTLAAGRLGILFPSSNLNDEGEEAGPILRIVDGVECVQVQVEICEEGDDEGDRTLVTIATLAIDRGELIRAVYTTAEDGTLIPAVPDVAAAAISGIPHNDRGQILWARLALDGGYMSPVTAGQMMHECRPFYDPTANRLEVAPPSDLNTVRDIASKYFSEIPRLYFTRTEALEALKGAYLGTDAHGIGLRMPEIWNRG